MAAKIHGRLGAVDLSATTDTEVYEVPAARKATVCVNVCNRNATSITVRLAYVDAAAVGSVANEDYIEYETTLAGYGVLERTGIPMTTGHIILARASAANVSVMAYGLEEDV